MRVSQYHSHTLFPASSHQTVREVFPHTAFLFSSQQGIYTYRLGTAFRRIYRISDISPPYSTASNRSPSVFMNLQCFSVLAFLYTFLLSSCSLMEAFVILPCFTSVERFKIQQSPFAGHAQSASLTLFIIKIWGLSLGFRNKLGMPGAYLSVLIRTAQGHGLFSMSRDVIPEHVSGSPAVVPTRWDY